MYCTVGEVLEMIKDDMKNVIIGDEYIEDEQEREAKIATLCESAISDACAEIDGYLAKRYRVPFTKTPQVINKFAKDISVYNLVSRTGIDESDREKTFLNRYNAAIKFLLDVAKGIISIGVEEKRRKQRSSQWLQDEVFRQGVLKGQYERMVMGCRQSGQRCPEILMSCSNA